MENNGKQQPGTQQGKDDSVKDSKQKQTESGEKDWREQLMGTTEQDAGGLPFTSTPNMQLMEARK